MLDIQIKDEFKTEVVGFNNSGLPLGKRNDLHLLAEMAHHNKGLQRFFKTLPSLEQIKAHREGKFLEENPVPQKEEPKAKPKEDTK